MTLKEIQKRLEKLKTKGFIPSRRKGPTGVGFTLEQELEISETNIAVPDIGGRVELKASRHNSNSLITLFTFNRGVWKIPQKEVIEKYGYADEDDRQALYNMAYIGQHNSQGLILELDEANQQIKLIHKPSQTLLASWSIYTIVGKFMTKLENAIFVFARTKQNKNGEEEFYFDEAHLLQNPVPEKFLEAFKNAKIAIDVRMHLKEKGTVRNHGTGIRIKEKDIPILYSKKKSLI